MWPRGRWPWGRTTTAGEGCKGKGHMGCSVCPVATITLTKRRQEYISLLVLKGPTQPLLPLYDVISVETGCWGLKQHREGSIRSVNHWAIRFGEDYGVLDRMDKKVGLFKHCLDFLVTLTITAWGHYCFTRRNTFARMFKWSFHCIFKELCEEIFVFPVLGRESNCSSFNWCANSLCN